MADSWWGQGYDSRLVHFSGVGMEAQGGPHRHRARKERRKQSLTQQEPQDAPDVFIEGRAQHDSQGMQTGQQGPGLGLPQIHTRGDSFRKRTDQHQGGAEQAGSGEGGPREGQKPRSKGSPWPPLLHASSGHRPESTVLQLVSARPRRPLLRPLSQKGRQTPSLPVCPAASLKTNGRRRQENQTQRQGAPSVKDTGKGGWKSCREAPRSPPTTRVWGRR